MAKLEKKTLFTHTFEGCVQTLVGGYSTYNIKASTTEVEAYKRMVEAYTVDEMNEAVYDLGFKVKVRKNANYFKLPKFAQKIYDTIKGMVRVVECKDGEVIVVS